MPSTLASTLAIKERGALAPVCPAVRPEPEFIDVAVVARRDRSYSWLIKAEGSREEPTADIPIEND
jgi:hypothetical protein